MYWDRRELAGFLVAAKTQAERDLRIFSKIITADGDRRVVEPEEFKNKVGKFSFYKK